MTAVIVVVVILLIGAVFFIITVLSCLKERGLFLLALSVAICVLLTWQTGEAACRSTSVKKQFDKEQHFKSGRPGYIVDHVCALSCGGLDIPANMQYQTLAESRLKDKWETTKAGCAKTCTATNSLPYRTVFNCK